MRSWDPDSGELRGEWRTLRDEAVYSLAWSSDGERLLLTTSDGVRVHRSDGELVARLDLGARTTAAAWTPDGRAIFAVDGWIMVLPLDDESWRADPAELVRAAERAAGATVSTLIGVSADEAP